MAQGFRRYFAFSGVNMGKKKKGPIDPKKLTAAELAQVLTKAGDRKVTAAQIRSDIKMGAPVRSDKRINLVHYAAWLAREAD